MTTNTYTQTRGASSPDIVIGQIAKNGRQEFRVTLKRWKNLDLLTGELIHTKDGVCMPIAALPGIVQLLQKAEAEARRLGLLPSDERRAA
jgi:hypothetical protein